MTRIKSFIFNIFYKSHRSEIKRLKEIIKRHEEQVPYDPRYIENHLNVLVNEITGGREFKFAVAHTGLSITEDAEPWPPSHVICRLDTHIGLCNMMPEVQPDLDNARKELVISLARGLGDAVRDKFLQQVGWR